MKPVRKPNESSVKDGRKGVPEGKEALKQASLVALLSEMQKYRDEGVQVFQEKKRLVFFCSICRVYAHSDNTLADHLRGKKHMRLLEASGPLNNNRSTGSSPPGSVNMLKSDVPIDSAPRVHRPMGQHNLRVTIAPPIVLPSSVTSGRKHQRSRSSWEISNPEGSETGEIVLQRDERDGRGGREWSAVRQEGAPNTHLQKTGIGHSETYANQKNSVGQRRKRKAGKKVDGNDDGEDKKQLVLKGSGGKSMGGTKKTKGRKAKVMGNELQGADPAPISFSEVDETKTAKSLEKDKKKKSKRPQSLCGEEHTGPVAVFFESSEEERSSPQKKWKREGKARDGRLEMVEYSAEEKEGAGEGREGVAKQEFALVLFKYDEMIGREGSFTPLSQSGNKPMKKGNENNVGDNKDKQMKQIRQKDIRERSLVEDEPRNLCSEGKGNLEEHLLNLVVDVLDERGEHSAASNGKSFESLTGCEGGRGGGEGGERQNQNSVDASDIHSKNTTHIVTQNNGEDVHSDMTSAREGHIDSKQESTMTTNDKNNNDNNQNKDSNNNNEEKEAMSGGEARAAKETPHQGGTAMASSQGQRHGGMSLKRQARERANLRGGNKGGEGMKVGGEDSAGSGQAKVGYGRERNRRSFERHCFICRKVMKPGVEVAALLNVGEKRLACSSRNKQGMFHVFHSLCLCNWVALCLRKSSSQTASPPPSAPPSSPPPSSALPPPSVLPPPSSPLLLEASIGDPSSGTICLEDSSSVLSLPAPSDQLFSEGEDSVNLTEEEKLRKSVNSDSWAIVPVPDEQLLKSPPSLFDNRSLWEVAKPQKMEGPFCPECQGSGVLQADGGLEKPKYRLAQVYECMLKLMQERTTGTKHAPPIIVAVPAVDEKDHDRRIYG